MPVADERMTLPIGEDRLYRTGTRVFTPNSVTRISIWLKKRYTKHLPQQSSSGRGQYSRQSRAWLVSTGRFKAIDTIRRRTRFNTSVTELAQQSDGEIDPLNALADPN